VDGTPRDPHNDRVMPRPLTALSFDDDFVRSLPGDPSDSTQPRQVPGVAYSPVRPTPVAAPRLLAWSEDVGRLLGLERPAVTGPEVDVLAGNAVLPGMRPYAARYGGHQFGNWAGQLGDGRAITLGEVLRDGARWELQLKGAGRTAYSRFADGRAVLRSSLREFLCSEAMHRLGVPTTRALSLVATGDLVVRDMFYDGNPQAEPGAIVCRVAPSFVRFGNFEIHAALDEHAPLKRLADWVITRHYPELGPPPPGGPEPGSAAAEFYARWFHEICRRTAIMIAEWMRVGFVHGVMNTDNMSILGLTIDYGPYGWLEGFDPSWTPNTTDAQGRRYAYGNQPQIGLWNCARLAWALKPLVADEELLEGGLQRYADTYTDAFRARLAQKLGLAALDRDDDDALVQGLFEVLGQAETDLTIFHRRLARVPAGEATDAPARREPLRDAFYDEAAALADEPRARLDAWLERWAARVRATGEPDEVRAARMNAANPKYVPRNYLAQLAIDAAAEGDTSVLERLMRVLERPYDEQPEHEDLAQRRPEWARHRAGCSALSCSS
jgi:uncharacterized protein YdiU (UPF0061 family)